ncbi:MAG: MFS transporter [Acetobacterales bacterium]
MRPLTIALTVSLPLTATFFLSHAFRTVHAVIAPRLATDLQLDATALGLLSGAFFIAYALVQLPVGLALDRFGPRRVQMALLSCASLGLLVFAIAGSVAGLAVGRALIGVGMAASLMAALKGNAMWWPRDRLPLINGITLALGGTGAMAATVPVEMVLRVIDWRTLFLLLTLPTLAVLTLTAATVPEPRRTAPAEPGLGRAVGVLRRIFSDRFFWRLAPATAMITGTQFAYLSLWIGPWLRDVAMLDPAAAARYMFVAMAMLPAGWMLIGMIMDRLQRYGVTPLAVYTGCFLLFILSQAALALELADLALLFWPLFALFSAVGNTGYSIFAQHFPSEMVGRVNTAQNLLVLSVGFLIQTGIGVVIDFWPGAADGRYDPTGYRTALWIGLALQALAFAWLIRPHRR